MPEAVSFGRWLRQKRRALDLSQKAFADQVGCAEITVRRMEADAYKPSQELALVLLEKLGVPEAERPQWVRFARGLAAYPNSQALSSPSRTQKTNLPTLSTSFIGREKEQKEIRSLFSSVRLITILGTGGMGKTRLSLQVGQELLNDYPDGVWFVPLGPLQSAGAIVPAVAKALDFSFYREAEPPRQQLLDYVREKHLLLILDSFEHLVDEGVALIVEMLTTAKHLKVLVTSRERLNFQGEQLYRLPGLRTPDAADIATWIQPEEQIKSFSALHLFGERARRVIQGFRLTRDNLAAVTEICNLVDGMPLGIELAATWVEILSPKEIAAEIIRSLDFLETKLRDVPDRHQSIRAVFESSWTLLNQEEQTAFQKLTIFQGSFSREAAQQVGGASLRVLLGLANKSWLQQVEGGRFQLHDVLRQYGYELLQSDANEWQAAKDRHAEYYIDFVEIQGKALQGVRQVEAIRTLNNEFGNNIPAAWNWLVESKRFGDLVNNMLPGLFHFCLVQSQGEGLIPMLRLVRESMSPSEGREQLLQQAIFKTVESFFGENWAVGIQPRERLIRLWAKVEEFELANEMGFWFFVLMEAYFEGVGFDDEFQGIPELIEQTRTKADPWMTGYILLSSVKMLSWLSLAEQEKYLKEALATFQEMGVLHEQGLTLLYLSSIAWNKKAFDEAEQVNRVARQLFEQAGDMLAVSHTWYRSEQINISRGDFDQALIANEERLRIYERMGNRRLMGITWSWQSEHASRYESLERAWDARQRSLALAQETGHILDIAWNNWNLGELYRLTGDVEQACHCYQQAFPLFERLQDYNGMGYYYRGLGEIAFGLEQWEEARSHFQKSLDVLKREHRYVRTWSLAYTQAGLGSCLVGLRDFSGAKQVLQSSVRNAQECGNWDLMLVSLMGFARLYAAVGTSQTAFELATFIANHRTSWNETKNQARLVLEIVSNDLPEETVRVAQGRGLAMTIDEAVEHVLQGG